MVKMDKITRLSLAKIKRAKKESFLLCILVMICTILLSSSVSSLVGIGKMMPSIAEETGCYRNFVIMGQDIYSDECLGFLSENSSVSSYDHFSVIMDPILKTKDGGTAVSICFIRSSDEERSEIFEPEVLEDAASLEHPIYLDSSCRMSMGLSLGDEVTYTDGKREYSFTVAGFFDQGLWPLGSKAVVSDEDYSYLEQHMDRYEIVGMDFASGVDANEFFKSYEEYCKGTTLNDVSSEYMSYAYKDLIDTYTLNMSILSGIVACMAGVTILAILVMIRYRIVGDIREQIVSIGVLEALGYKSADISLSYVVEYLIVAGVGAVLGIVPGVMFSSFLMTNAATTAHYGGDIKAPLLPALLSVLGILLFVLLISHIRARAVRKYPPVKAFRKGIETHHFKKTILPLEKSRSNIHISLALKGFFENAKQNIGLGVCIAAVTLTVVISFMMANTLGNKDNLLNNICGHELADIRIETSGLISTEDFASELLVMPEVSKVLMTSDSEYIKIADADIPMLLDIYDDFSSTTNIIVSEGRLPEHDNEIAFTVQGKFVQNMEVGDTVMVEYGKIRKEYVVTGFVNSVVNASAGYMTSEGFRRFDPLYTPDILDIYLDPSVDASSFASVLESRYGKDIADISGDEVTGDTMEERIRSAADIKMAEAMVENGVSYMEYSIEVDGQIISGSTNTMRIDKLTFQRADYAEIMDQFGSVIGTVTTSLTIVAAVVVMIILSILMENTIRKQYRELGIMKGLGYTSRELMFQMSFRIVPVAVIAALVGTFLSFVSMGLIEMVLGKLSVSIPAVAVVVICVLLFCFFCAYTGARKIKKISVYELMTE